MGSKFHCNLPVSSFQKKPVTSRWLSTFSWWNWMSITKIRSKFCSEKVIQSIVEGGWMLITWGLCFEESISIDRLEFNVKNSTRSDVRPYRSLILWWRCGARNMNWQQEREVQPWLLQMNSSYFYLDSDLPLTVWIILVLTQLTHSLIDLVISVECQVLIF